MLIHLEPSQVPATLRQGYAGKSFKARIADSVTIPSHAGLWDGGSRETYSVVELETGRSVPVSKSSAPWAADRRDETVTLQPGLVVVEHSIFCGKDMGLTFYVHADNAQKLLPAPAELTPHERCVLVATRSLKSSYGGQDRYDMAENNCRYDHYATEYGVTKTTFPSREEWNAAKQSLIGRGMLNKAGAITTKGRNAVPSKY